MVTTPFKQYSLIEADHLQVVTTSAGLNNLMRRGLSVMMTLYRRLPPRKFWSSPVVVIGTVRMFYSMAHDFLIWRRYQLSRWSLSEWWVEYFNILLLCCCFLRTANVILKWTFDTGFFLHFFKRSFHTNAFHLFNCTTKVNKFAICINQLLMSVVSF